MARSITLTLQAAVHERTSNGFYAVRARIVASGNEGMPAEVFVFQRHLLDPYSETYNASFCGVADPQDLVDLPVAAPNTGTLPPLFRRAEIDTLVANRQTLEQLFADVHEEVCGLVEALNQAERLSVSQEVVCGDYSDVSLSGG